MRTHLCILLALSLAIPIGSANWSYRGSNEPDNAFDTTSYMFFDPDTDPNQAAHKMYFNVFARVARYSHLSPNVAAVGSAIQPPVTAMSAVLGFWKDCNNDGYIGQIESALIEYRSELLLDSSICAPRTPVSGQSIYPHNDGTWVRELIWVGPAKDAVGAPSSNPTNFYADGTRVWGDWGLPGAPPVLVCNGGGNLGLRSTGAILDVVDCNTYYKGIRTMNDVQDATGAPTGGWETHDVDNSPSALNVDNPVYPFLYGPAEPEGDPFEGDYRGYSGGIFGRDSGTGPGEQRERMVTLVDCDSDTVAPSTDVNTPGDPLDPATYPSLWESLNDTYEVQSQNPSGGDGGNVCNPSGDADEGLGYQTVHPEAYNENVFADQGRAEVDHRFEFSTGSRNSGTTAPGPAFGTCRGTTTQTYTTGLLGYCAPEDLGLAAERDDGPIGPAWRTNPQIVTYTITTRDQALQSDTPDMGAWYMTFYATIGASAKSFGSIPSTQISTYGSEACGENDVGIHNSWNCDEAAWRQRCVDTETATLPEQCYRVGFTYDMRDIDCWDNTLVRGSGVRVGLSDLSESGPCALNDANQDIDVPTVG